MTAWVSEYRPPGNSVAYFEQLLELERYRGFRRKEHAVDDALGEQLVGFGRRLLQHCGADRLTDIGRHPAADAKFQPLQIGKPVDRALGVVHDPRAVGIDREQLHAGVLVGLGAVRLVDAPHGDRLRLGVVAAERQHAEPRQRKPRGRIAMRDECQIGKPVLDRVEVATRTGHHLGQEPELDAAVGGALDLLRPSRQKVFVQKMRRRDPT